MATVLTARHHAMDDAASRMNGGAAMGKVSVEGVGVGVGVGVSDPTDPAGSDADQEYDSRDEVSDTESVEQDEDGRRSSVVVRPSSECGPPTGFFAALERARSAVRVNDATTDATIDADCTSETSPRTSIEPGDGDGEDFPPCNSRRNVFSFFQVFWGLRLAESPRSSRVW
eukprot:CAMPEP_0206323866 /NCGR_PEP_ID=MMETSP0106_2-20121207/20209_1 /ASSEMBLY_ACC=CAM_ASM_000206 /TAXON_ID=81532 /ORGANISM="Acanthoeca-like sp., Strain 10tr" /LENGTH=170 /DNA_ID=CAMNT_0053756177 /DNA_START=380 /DNA_END=889 /DNA_ORIENTATION=-